MITVTIVPRLVRLSAWVCTGRLGANIALPVPTPCHPVEPTPNPNPRECWKTLRRYHLTSRPKDSTRCWIEGRVQQRFTLNTDRKSG